jgi:hypothetical protein
MQVQTSTAQQEFLPVQFASMQPQEMPGHQEHILVVDDEASVRGLLGRIDIYTLQAEWFLLKWEYVAKPL